MESMTKNDPKNNLDSFPGSPGRAAGRDFLNHAGFNRNSVISGYAFHLGNFGGINSGKISVILEPSNGAKICLDFRFP